METCTYCPQPAENKVGAKPTCYDHCGDSPDGNHSPEWDTAEIYADHGAVMISEANTIIVDVNCRYCGQSGSIPVPITGPDSDVQWS